MATLTMKTRDYNNGGKNRTSCDQSFYDGKNCVCRVYSGMVGGSYTQPDTYRFD